MGKILEVCTWTDGSQYHSILTLVWTLSPALHRTAWGRGVWFSPLVPSHRVLQCEGHRTCVQPLWDSPLQVLQHPLQSSQVPMESEVCGCVGVRVCGCEGVWVCGCVDWEGDQLCHRMYNTHFQTSGYSPQIGSYLLTYTCAASVWTRIFRPPSPPFLSATLTAAQEK